MPSKQPQEYGTVDLDTERAKDIATRLEEFGMPMFETREGAKLAFDVSTALDNLAKQCREWRPQ